LVVLTAKVKEEAGELEIWEQIEEVVCDQYRQVSASRLREISIVSNVMVPLQAIYKRKRKCSEAVDLSNQKNIPSNGGECSISKIP
jgi:hypothetical protein